MFIQLGSRAEIHPQKERVWTLSPMSRSAIHQKLGTDTHPERKGGGSVLSEEECTVEVCKSHI